VSKRLGSIYRSGKCKNWLKFKNPAAPAVNHEAERNGVVAIVAKWIVIIEGKLSEERVVALDPSDVEFLHDLAFSTSRRHAPPERWGYWPSEKSEPLAFTFQCGTVAEYFVKNCKLKLFKAYGPLAG
jgi:hypothetical protein